MEPNTGGSAPLMILPRPKLRFLVPSAYVGLELRKLIVEAVTKKNAIDLEFVTNPDDLVALVESTGSTAGGSKRKAPEVELKEEPSTKCGGKTTGII